jgi:hypothetical protein
MNSAGFLAFRHHRDDRHLRGIDRRHRAARPRQLGHAGAGHQPDGGQVIRSSATTQTSSLSYVNVPGTLTNITVPAGKQALIVVRFAASSKCVSIPGVLCRVRVLVGGVEASPAGSNVDVWDSASGGGIPSHAIERSLLKGPGTHTVKVQYRVNVATELLALFGFHMTVERIIQ